MADLTVDDLKSALKEQANTFLSGISKAVQGKDPKGGNGSSGGGNSGGSGGFKASTKDLTLFQNALTSAQTTLHNLGGRELASMSNNVRTTVSSVKEFSGKMKESTGIASKFSLGMTTGLTLAMSAGASIAGALHESLGVYQQTRTYGQTFNGSILGMHLAAAQARMPLKDFADALKNNATTVAIIGQQGFGKLSVGLRKSLMDVGQLGMTTSELNDVVGNYMTTMMLFGKLQTTSNQQATMSMRNLSIEASALAEASGKSRMQLMKDTTDALSLATLRAVAMDTQGEAGVKFADNMSKATMFMASLPGEAGKTLSNMLAQTVGNGSALLTEDMTEFTKAGMYGVGNMMESMADKIKSGKDIDPGEMAKFYSEFLAEGKDAEDTLRFQASTGNKQAQKMLAMYEDMASHSSQYTEAELKKAYENQKHQKDITNAMTNFETVFNNVTGAIKEQFFKAIIDFTNSKSFATLKTDMDHLKDSLAALWGKIFTPQNIATATTFMVSTFEILAWVGSKIASVANILLSAFNALANKVGGVTAVLGTLAAAFAARWLYKKAKKEIADSKARVAAMEGTRDGFTAAIRPLVMSSALRVIDASSGKSNGMIDALPEEEGKGGKGGKGKTKGRFRNAAGRFNKGFNKYGASSLALGTLAADSMMDDNTKGKATVTAALGGAATGAQVGTMLEPLLLALGPATMGISDLLAPFAPIIGATVGAAVGAISANWDDIKDAVGKGFDWVTDKVGGIFNWFGEVFSVAHIKKMFSSAVSTVSDGISSGLDTIKNVLEPIIMFIPNLIGKMGEWVASKFSWLKDFNAMAVFKTALSLFPGGAIAVKAFDMAFGDKAVGGAAATADSKVPNVEVDTLKKRVDDLAKQLAQQQKDNQILHQQLDKLISEVKNGNNSNAAHQKAQLGETKKGNQALTNPLTGLAT